MIESSAYPQPSTELRCTPARSSVPVWSMVSRGLLRRSNDGCGPSRPNAIDSENAFPVRARVAACARTFGVMKFTEPSSSSAPHRPQLLILRIIASTWSSDT